MRSPVERVAKDGTRTWAVRFRTAAGRQSSKTFVTQRAARIFAQDIEHRGVAYALDLLADERAKLEGAPLAELAEQFFTWKEARVRSDRTVPDYRRDYRNWIAPTFGERTAATITRPEVQQWVDDMATGKLGRTLSPKAVADRHAILHQIYAWASASTRGLVTDNPCIGTDLPKRRRPMPKGLRPAEWVALYAALRQVDADAADLALFMLSSGWRWSEAIALSTYEVEDDGQRVHVTMTRVVRRDAMGRHLIVADAKSAAGERRVALDSEAAAVVRRRVSAQHPGGLVFTTSGGSQWHYANFRSRYWLRAVKVANLARKPTPHWLRHTHVAWMVIAGASLPDLQSRIGHASIKTTIDVYGSMITDVQPSTLAGFAAVRDGSTTGGAWPRVAGQEKAQLSS